MARKKSDIEKKLIRVLGKMANDAFKSEEYTRFLSIPMTRKRAAYYIFERSHFHLNRRECWALVQARAPFDVKQMIWHHEEDELAGSAERGVENHWILGMREGAALGLKRSDFNKPPSDGTAICTHAWARIAEAEPWLASLASSCILEIANSDAIVKGGGIANRIAQKIAKEAKVPLKKQVSNVEHMEVDITHANLLYEVLPKHVKTKRQAEEVLHGARLGIGVNKTWFGLMAAQIENMR
ncbi:MAG: hypothetical protein V3R85_01525 [Alphaproteobacteria bacterium]